jgi:hypothetical protein
MNTRESPVRGRRPVSEYRRTICMSAEKRKDDSIRDQDYPQPTKLHHESLALPSYQKFKDKNNEISDAENRLMKLQMERETVQSEYDRIPTHRAKTVKHKMRKEELENRLDEIASEISKIKKVLRDY